MLENIFCLKLENTHRLISLIHTILEIIPEKKNTTHVNFTQKLISTKVVYRRDESAIAATGKNDDNGKNIIDKR